MRYLGAGQTAVRPTGKALWALLAVSGAVSCGAAGAERTVAAWERMENGPRPLYRHDRCLAFRARAPWPELPGATLKASSEAEGIAVYALDQHVLTRRDGVVAAARRAGADEIPCYSTPDGRFVVPTDLVVVQFHPGVSSREVDSFLAARGARAVATRANHPGRLLAHLPHPADALPAACAWHASPLVRWAQANCLREAVPRFLPNDPLFLDQWSLRNTGQGGSVLHRDVGAGSAWDITRGSTGIVVAVLDTGLELDHPDLSANVFTNEADPLNAIDDDGNGYTNDIHGWDFVDNDNDPSPVSPNENHGMPIAGVILAAADNTAGVAGLAHRCRLLPLRVYNPDTVVDINWADAVEYAAQFADVINISYLIHPTPLNHDALRYATVRGRNGLGSVICASLGNDGVLRRFAGDLAASPEVLSVSGNSNYDRRSWFGDHGPALNVLAPAGGGNLWMASTDRLGSNGYEPGDYCVTNREGTSYACALVSAVAALVASAHPDWTGLEIRRQIEATCDRIDANAFVYDARGWNVEYGHGRVNAQAALAAAPGPWDPYEPDDTAGGAAAIADGEMQYRSLATGADVDWVRIVTTNTSDFRLTAVGTTNLSLDLYDGSLALIATNDSGYPSYAWLTATGMAAGTYYARVRTPPAVPVPRYGLHFGILNAADAYEPDNVRTAARPIAPRTMQYHTFHTGDDADWATFSLTGDTSVALWTFGDAGGDTILLLVNSNAVVIASNDNYVSAFGYASPYSYLSNNLSAGTYYVQVLSHSNLPLATWQLLLETWAPDGYEPNETNAQAVAMASGDRLSCTLFPPTSDFDWFTFELPGRANVLIMTDSINPNWGGDTVVILYSNDLQVVAVNDQGNNYSYSAIYQANLPAGTYYIRVEAYDDPWWEQMADPDYYVSLDVFPAEAGLTNLVRGTNGVQVSWSGDAAFTYRVDVTTNTPAAGAVHWAAATNLEGRVGANAWTDRDAATTRWYRVAAE